MVDAALEETDTAPRRVRDLPSRVVVYLLLGAALFEGLGYQQVWSRMIAGLDGLDVASPTQSALAAVPGELAGPAVPLRAVPAAGPTPCPRAQRHLREETCHRGEHGDRHRPPVQDRPRGCCAGLCQRVRRSVHTACAPCSHWSTAVRAAIQDRHTVISVHTEVPPQENPGNGGSGRPAERSGELTMYIGTTTGRQPCRTCTTIGAGPARRAWCLARCTGSGAPGLHRCHLHR
jgi:hypothetical protein